MLLLNFLKRVSLILLCLFMAGNRVLAAEVPPGARLAKIQVFNRGNSAEPKTLDPQKAEESSGWRILHDLFQGLTTEDAYGNIIPGHAQSWTVSPNGLVYTFKLRDNARWSDGSPVTADDFVYGYQRVVDPKIASTYSFILSPVKNADQIIAGLLPVSALGIRAINKLTVEITLNHPTPFFLDITALVNTVPAHRASILKHKDKFTHPGNLVSNGPYMLKSWIVGDKITLVRNPYYWNNKKTVIDTVNFYPIESIHTETKMFLAGQLDWTDSIPADQFKSLKETLGDMIKSSPFLSIYYYVFNLNLPKFKDVKLRQALSMAIDREVIANTIMGRGEIPSYDFVPLGTRNYQQNSYEWQFRSRKEQIAEAQRLFHEAGYSKEHPLELRITYNTNESHKKVAIAIASMWQKILDVKVTIKNEEWKQFLSNRHSGDFEIQRSTWVGDYNDVSTFLGLFHSKNPQNIPHYKNEKYDKLLNEATIEQDVKKRKDIFKRLSSIVMNDYIVLPLFSHVTTHMVKPYVGGYCVTNALDRVLTNHLYILEH